MAAIYNPFTLSGKRILITGASSGIGRATALECSKMGAELIITGRNIKNLNETFLSLAGKGHQQHIVDITIEDEVDVFISQIPELNGIVSAAGMVRTLPFKFIHRTDLESIFDINFMAPVLLTQKLIKRKKLKKLSSVVFISSIDGPVIAHVGNSMYAASKGAVSAIVRSMALELASRKIRVNGILPGMIETPLINSDVFTEEQLESDMKRYPLKRYGKPAEIAYSAIYLLSDASLWVTGTNSIIDGGFSIT